MRKVLIKDKIRNSHFQSYLLESKEDLEELRIMLNKCVKGLSLKFIKSTLPVGKLGHLVGTLQGMERSLAALATLDDTNPLWELPFVAQKYFDGISKSLISGDKILLNDSAGWRALNEDLQIVKDVEDINLDLPDILIKNPTKYINIENDIALEPEAVKYLERVDKNYSYITNLRILSDEGLFEYFYKFIENGGSTLYVYTSGFDVLQAKRFYEIAWKSGISYFEVQMSSEMTQPYFDLLVKLKARKHFVKGVRIINAIKNTDTERFAQMLDES